MPNEDHSKEASVLLSNLKSFVLSSGYSFERPNRSVIGADYGFIISKQAFKVYGALYNTEMTGQIWKEIKPTLYNICESRKDSCFIILNDLMKNQFVLIPYTLLQHCLNPKTSGGRTLWQFAIQRNRISRTSYRLLKYGGGTIDIPESCVNNFQPLLQAWQDVRDTVTSAKAVSAAPAMSMNVQSSTPSIGKSIDYEDPPASVVIEIIRRIRDTEKARQLKARYSNHCQICQTRLSVGGNRFYSEVHHLRPLGGKAQGLDNEDNMLVLCPNHHALFDYLGIGIEPSDKITVVDAHGGIIGKLKMLQNHSLNLTNIQYHHEQMITKHRVHR